VRVPHPPTEEPGQRDVAPQIPQDQAPKSEEYKKPCDSPAKREEDDTCSQWRSANAAEAATRAAIDQASLAWWGIWVGVVSAIATAVAALAAAAAARAAVMATKEASEANSIARDTAKRQLRAFVAAERSVLEIKENLVVATIAIVNSGQTPAYHFDHCAWIGFGHIGETKIFEEGPHRPKSGAHIPSSGNCGAIIESDRLTESQIAKIKLGKIAVWVWGTIWYEDVFGDAQRTKFRFVYTGFATTPAGVMLADEEGNEAT
jgi:hypothetical protein